MFALRENAVRRAGMTIAVLAVAGAVVWNVLTSFEAAKAERHLEDAYAAQKISQQVELGPRHDEHRLLVEQHRRIVAVTQAQLADAEQRRATARLVGAIVGGIAIFFIGGMQVTRYVARKQM